jgi:hypothetical protein
LLDYSTVLEKERQERLIKPLPVFGVPPQLVYFDFGKTNKGQEPFRRNRCALFQLHQLPSG